MGQGVITTLAGLLHAQGCQVRLVMPEVPIEGNQPPFEGTNLRAAIRHYAANTVPGAVVVAAKESHSDDLVFILGDSQWDGAARHAWRMAPDLWSGRLVPESARIAPVVGDYGLGAGAAAVAAAVEPFKCALRSVASDAGLSVPIPELLQETPWATIQLGEDIGPPTEPELGTVDFVSGGAITNAALHALLRIRNLRGQIRIIEPENVELSNLNRYVLCRGSDVGASKAAVLASFGSRGLAIEPVPTKLERSTLPSVSPLGDLVIVGADSVPARWLAQAQWPEHLIVGATAEFMTMTSSHGYPGPCAGCAHPLDDDVNVTIPTVSFVSYLAGLFVATRALRHAMKPGDLIEHLVSHLWPLRLDLAESTWWHPLQADSRCPVKCPASKNAL